VSWYNESDQFSKSSAETQLKDAWHIRIDSRIRFQDPLFTNLTTIPSQINNRVSVVVPESRDFIVTVRLLVLPENPQFTFDNTFTMR